MSRVFADTWVGAWPAWFMAQKVTAMDVRAATALAGGVENVAQFCREHHVSRQTFYKWRRRFAAEGLAGLEPRSRRPHTAPGRSGDEVEALAVATRRRLQSAGCDHGPQSIVWTLQREGVLTLYRVANSAPSRADRCRAGQTAEVLDSAVLLRPPQRVVAVGLDRMASRRWHLGSDRGHHR
ncbi:helix-turn-helix domain-containing protein [Gordonia soli]|uniref:helix-turn-helix domain-containing protein n=1 Tax=Gordonia soli TaxID=320799 RepID=UPI003F6F9558